MELTVVAVPAGYAAAELGVSRITGDGIDHRTGQVLIHTSDE